MTDCQHIWMPPRSGGLQAKAAVMGERHVRIPGGKVFHFTPLEADDPEHCWLHRWCLICRAPHPIDAAQPDAIAVQAAIEATMSRFREAIDA